MVKILVIAQSAISLSTVSESLVMGLPNLLPLAGKAKPMADQLGLCKPRRQGRPCEDMCRSDRLRSART